LGYKLKFMSKVARKKLLLQLYWSTRERLLFLTSGRGSRFCPAAAGIS
jgi:hypothetical protein